MLNLERARGDRHQFEQVAIEFVQQLREANPLFRLIVVQHNAWTMRTPEQIELGWDWDSFRNFHAFLFQMVIQGHLLNAWVELVGYLEEFAEAARISFGDTHRAKKQADTATAGYTASMSNYDEDRMDIGEVATSPSEVKPCGNDDAPCQMDIEMEDVDDDISGGIINTVAAPLSRPPIMTTPPSILLAPVSNA